MCVLLQADRDPEGPVDRERAKTDAQVCGPYSGQADTIGITAACLLQGVSVFGWLPVNFRYVWNAKPQ